jgi:hypothetical protein
MDNAMLGAISYYTSCTPHRRGVRIHISFSDFDGITCGDTYNSNALSAFEMATNERIRQLRERYDIPETHLPSIDDLWIHMPYRTLERLTGKRVSKSVCQRILAEKSAEGIPPSLLELGFLRRRYIARRTFDVGSRPATTVYRDDDGEFIIIDDTSGNYQGDDGQTYSAMSAGYGYVEWQYLYCIEEVLRAIAALDQAEPPDRLPRWESMIEAHIPEEKKAGTTRPASESLIPSKIHSSATDCNDPGTSQAAFNPSGLDDITQRTAVSREMKGKYTKLMEPIKQPMKQVRLYHERLDEAILYNAEWCAETVLGLASMILDVPLPPDPLDAEAQHIWYSEWQQPVQRLMAATCTLSPQLAWERIDLTIRYMATPGSPSWWQRGPESGMDWRRTKAPVTLRNVADRYIFEYDELMRNRSIWWPKTTTPYAGPPLEFASFADREQGDPTTDEVVVVEVPRLRRRRPPLTQAQAEELARCMLEDVPNLIIDGIREYKPGAWGVDIDTSRTGGITITSVERWYAPPDRLIPKIDEAIAYAYAVQSEEIAKQQEKKQ